MPVFQGFIGPSYRARSLNFDAQRCLNLYLEKSGSGSSKNGAMLVGTPGLRTWSNPPGRAVRGVINFNKVYAFVVIGQYVYRMDTSGGFTLTGLIVNGATPVSMATNGINILLVTGPNGYVIDPVTNTLTTYSDVSFHGADRVDFIRGNYVFNEPGTGKFWSTDPYSTVIDPLNFGNAEGSPDSLISLIVDHEELWLFGSDTTEVWVYNGDTANFPYNRIDGAFFEQGCAAAHSPVKMAGAIYWLSANSDGEGMIFRANGFQPERISTHAIEKAIAEYDRIDDAVGYTYQQEGHSFYVLNFPSGNATWVFDATSGEWHERGYRQSDGQYGRHRGNCHMFFGRKNLVGDWQNGNIYEMDLDIYSDDGNALVRLRSSPHVVQELNPIAHHNIQIDMETGIGISAGQGSEPEGLLRWSDDGGHAYSNQRRKKLGRIGSYRTRAKFTRLGQSRDRVYEFSISDPVKVVLIGAVINA